MDRVYKRLEDYGVIGNLETCALVGNDGSIDWCCFPHLESPSVFAAILDAEKGGYFRIGPKHGVQAKQSYLEDTNILQTTFQCESGTVVLTDFMPVIEGSYSDASGIVVRAIAEASKCKWILNLDSIMPVSCPT
ncbi:MAG TPA: trehalase-like domain-containing protein [Thermodesulfobacteriota bacterium]|nr:trehalase-like domain-containing protein [Thermodesulfobacteriota bacterium]